MTLGTKYFFEFWSSKDTYSSSILRSDINKIENYYFDRGYIRFRVISNQVNLSNDNKDIIITINVDEGKKYEFGDLKLFGNSVLPPNDVINNISSSLVEIIFTNSSVTFLWQEKDGLSVLEQIIK